MSYHVSDNKLYCVEVHAAGVASQMFEVDLTDDNDTTYGSIIGSDSGVPDAVGYGIYKNSNGLYVLILYQTNAATNVEMRIYKWVDPNWVQQAAYDTGSTDFGVSSDFVSIGSDFYSLYDPDGTELRVLFYNDGAGTFTLKDTDTDHHIKIISHLPALTYDGSNLIYFIGLSNVGIAEYLLTYSISGTSISVGGLEPIIIMSSWQTVNSAIPFNKEKAFGTDSSNNLCVYQIPQQSNKGMMWKIADLMNDSTINSGEIVGVTDTYLFIEETDGNIELWKFQDFSVYIQECKIVMCEREAHTAIIVYDSLHYYLEQGMIVQVIGTFKGSANQVKFEGYVINPVEVDPSETRFKTADLRSPAWEDLEIYSPELTTSTGDTDAYIDDMDDNFNYITKGAYSDGYNWDTDPDIIGEKRTKRILNEFGLIDQFTWYLTPLGALYYNNNTVSSGVTYTETHLITSIISYRNKRYNSVVINGGYVSGTRIESAEQKDDQLIQEFNKIALSMTIAWLTTVADANQAASSALTLFKANLKYIKFTVRDTTNGTLQVGETVDVSHSQKPEISTNATYKINQVVDDDKRGICEYTVSSGLRYEIEDFLQRLDEDNSTLITMVNDYADTKLANVVEDTTPQLGGNLDVNGNIITGFTASRALETDGSGNLGVSAITSTELGYLDGVTSEIQTQLDALSKTITGNYNGDGTGNAANWSAYKEIDLSAQFSAIKKVEITAESPSDATRILCWCNDDEETTDYCHFLYVAAGVTHFSYTGFRLRIVSGGKFQVNDAGVNNSPNCDGVTFYYTVWGTPA